MTYINSVLTLIGITIICRAPADASPFMLSIGVFCLGWAIAQVFVTLDKIEKRNT